MTIRSKDYPYEAKEAGLECVYKAELMNHKLLNPINKLFQSMIITELFLLILSAAAVRTATISNSHLFVLVQLSILEATQTGVNHEICFQHRLWVTEFVSRRGNGKFTAFYV